SLADRARRQARGQRVGDSGSNSRGFRLSRRGHRCKPRRMPSFIAESYLARARREELSSQATRARDAASALASEGQPVAYLRTAFVPEDEICLHWFIAPSPAVVTELARLAKLEF